ncbi:MAG: glycosyltransferase family 87 protein [Actinomycetes bacterium]|jgi:uncharacterized membrane protein|nr:glycosyltransferase 87 family protein [Candidatus Nanopelagicales bacterium]MDP4888729.1 glycosyltransferase 87 family protein [Candidatus Nanopelagicales bacterium]
MSRVIPSLTDPVVRAGSAISGGPLGRFARVPAGSWWTPLRILIVMAAGAYALGFLLDVPCAMNGWASPERYEHLCYSDIPPLFSARGFADGFFPYLQMAPGGEPLEYPVLIGLFMQVTAWVTRGIGLAVPDLNSSLAFFGVNVVMLYPFLLLAVWATSRTMRRRPWDAAMIALAPSMILAATINWDLIAVGLAAAAIALWARAYPVAAGVLLGLAVAAKFYPVLFLGPLLILCLRAGRMRAWWRLAATTVFTWLVINLPFALVNFDGWFRFYDFSSTRGQDFGSIWYAAYLWGAPSIPPDLLNYVATGAFLILCGAIAALIWFTPRRPRLGAMLFLVVAAFVVTNKVYSPQFVLWLIPLAVLARPVWRDFLVWQAGQVAYFIAIWWYLAGLGIDDAKGMTPEWYAFFVFVQVGVTVWFSALIVRDAIYPELDPIRHEVSSAGESSKDIDDPAGGVLDGAPDRYRRQPRTLAP